MENEKLGATNLNDGAALAISRQKTNRFANVIAEHFRLEKEHRTTAKNRFYL
jgi:hypothetical protein